LDEPPSTCSNWREFTCEASCADLLTCSDCTLNEQCGWCNSSLCIERNSTEGVNQLYCDTWGLTNCPFDCSYNGQCETCIIQEKCGWCTLQSDTCVFYDGNSSNCEGNLNVGHCPVYPLDCRAYLDCNSCVEKLGCSWCGGNEGCVTSSTVFSACKQTCFELAVGWIIVIAFAGLVVVSSIIGSIAWYRIYWTKRHYYETLK